MISNGIGCVHTVTLHTLYETFALLKSNVKDTRCILFIPIFNVTSVSEVDNIGKKGSMNDA